ncbi:hypothetical protein H696_00589 [Fonticula alba]|uniref:Oxidized purine nucleoside triphosphate hydrolase n=1 Tax=Fonticula alba TaxID=691883 RepID=A0A058ZGF9_FONAL|nr:hypothetical protein H696_00589 [Fonticula alba]KCV73041.1 hypothetical protein H696_00589 [Fonticula alba]|eukprot:XP_009492742.1 hypothetical protein H696_00589 [Fonticula alba]
MTHAGIPDSDFTFDPASKGHLVSQCGAVRLDPGGAGVAVFHPPTLGDTNFRPLDAPRKGFTLVFPLRAAPDAPGRFQVLLGEKKRGLGQGLINGFGGKIEPGETSEECAIRELAEEAHLHATSISFVGRLNFNLPSADPNRLLDVHVFVAWQFTGSPVETPEMRPFWVDADQVPFSAMWPDDTIWLPYLLSYLAGVYSSDQAPGTTPQALAADGPHLLLLAHFDMPDQATVAAYRLHLAFGGGAARGDTLWAALSQ